MNVRLHARSDAVVEAHYRGDQAVSLIFDFVPSMNPSTWVISSTSRRSRTIARPRLLRSAIESRLSSTTARRSGCAADVRGGDLLRGWRGSTELAPRQTALRALVSPQISGVQCHGGNRRLRVPASILRRTSFSRREVPLLEALACASESRTHASASKHGRDAVFSVALAAVPCRRPLKIHRTPPRRAPSRRRPRRR